MVWNPQGLNDRSRGYVVRDAVVDAAASIACLVESKLAVVNHHTIARVLGPQFDQFVFLPVNNTAGGIIVAW